MQNPPPGLTGKSSTGLDENIAALLAYIFGWVSGLIFFLIEKDSKLVRFHAMQSILFNVLVAIVCFVGWIVTIVFILIASQLGDVLGTLASLIVGLIWLIIGAGLLIALILCLVRAYQGKFFKLPFIGDLAEKIVNK
jgi:uncharacterized membrane protein